ncbi:hypothetical protein [Bacillus cytotoxicus]|uniref:hypothetical protein n=1 Tax=Bacillus cytotoxicus TaxID=580165 RepID=UPI00244D719C|nr:hypothetical protein [Bacillus cytotoxicus]MDH2886724.1 hypothetical protein [Bacillus cytotoxicus]
MQRKISIKMMTDYHLYEFMRCPHKYYFRHIKRRESSSLEWQQIVQMIVNQIVHEYYLTSKEKQTEILLLKLLEKHWHKVKTSMFSSKIEYYIVLAKLTDHLLQFVKKDESKTPPLFLYEKIQMYMEELGIHISLTFEIGEWSSQSFVIKKYVVDGNEEMFALCQKLTTVFCYKAFGILPETIEFVNLIEGTRYEYVPKDKDIIEGIEYLKIMKEMIIDSRNYMKASFHSKCANCVFQRECVRGNQSVETTIH